MEIGYFQINGILCTILIRFALLSCSRQIFILLTIDFFSSFFFELSVIQSWYQNCTRGITIRINTKQKHDGNKFDNLAIFTHKLNFIEFKLPNGWPLKSVAFECEQRDFSVYQYGMNAFQKNVLDTCLFWFKNETVYYARILLKVLANAINYFKNSSILLKLVASSIFSVFMHRRSICLGKRASRN